MRLWMPAAYWKMNWTPLQGIFSRSLIIYPSMAALHLRSFSSGLPAWRRWGAAPKYSRRGHEAQQILLQSKAKKISLLTLYTSLSFEVKYYLSIWPVQLVRAHPFRLMMGFEGFEFIVVPCWNNPQTLQSFCERELYPNARFWKGSEKVRFSISFSPEVTRDSSLDLRSFPLKTFCWNQCFHEIFWLQRSIMLCWK